MQGEQNSFWMDIKNLEAKLALSPDSYCYSALSEVYLKVGLLDDALYTAQRGIRKYPGHIAGLRAFVRACHAKGMVGEAKDSLEKLVVAIPEDGEMMGMLAQLQVESGNDQEAIALYRTMLDCAPNDEIQARLDTVLCCTAKAVRDDYDSESADDGVNRHPSDEVTALISDAAVEEDEEIIEDLEMLEEIEILEDDEEYEYDGAEELGVILATGEPLDIPAASVKTQDPLHTTTIAELYVRQGFVEKALGIYRDIQVAEPGNRSVRARIVELEALVYPPQSPVSVVASDSYTEQAPPPRTAAFLTGGVETVFGADHHDRDAAQSALSTLEQWLDNIRRLKACP